MPRCYSLVDSTGGSGNGKVRSKAPGGSVNITRALRLAMHEIAKSKGDFTLFALFMPAAAPLMRTDDPGTWDLVVSAPWLERGRLKAHRELVDLLAKLIGKRALMQLSRVEPVAADDPRIRFILKGIPVEDGEQHIQNTDLMGMQIERGIVFRAWKPRARKSASKELHPVAAGLSRSRG